MEAFDEVQRSEWTIVIMGVLRVKAEIGSLPGDNRIRYFVVFFDT